MNSRYFRSAGWAACFSGITSIIGFVSLILFFGLESTPNTAQTPHFWGPLSDIAPIFQMLSMLVVLRGLFWMRRPSPQGFVLFGSIIGILGMLGVVILQILLILKVIPFEQEVVLVLYSTAAVGVWLVFVNQMGQHQGWLPARLAWLGIAAGIAFILEPVMLSAAGGAVAWRVFMSNYLLLFGSAIVFLVSYVGFPVWAFGFGSVFLRRSKAEEGSIWK
jgi:hypothetical protein